MDCLTHATPAGFHAQLAVPGGQGIIWRRRNENPTSIPYIMRVEAASAGNNDILRVNVNGDSRAYTFTRRSVLQEGEESLVPIMTLGSNGTVSIREVCVDVLLNDGCEEFWPGVLHVSRTPS